jgi:hypothetical protein
MSQRSARIAMSKIKKLRHRCRGWLVARVISRFVRSFIFGLLLKVLLGMKKPAR